VVRFATPETPAPLVVWRPAPRPRPVRAPEPSSVSASADPEGAWRAFDGDAASAWTAGGGRGWIEARWQEPLLIGRVEVDAGEHWPQRLRLSGGSGDERQVLVAPRLRPRFGQLEGVPAGQVFVLTPPRRLEALRLVRPQGAQWSVAELRVYLAAPR
jgi:hypothetical protein